MKTRLRDLEKTVTREHRDMEKKMKNRKKRTVDPNAEPSGFAKPGPVSDELCKFLGLAAGTHIARTEVTKGINKYCKEHKLQKESDKRTILPDKNLKSLLRLQKGDDVTFFNLQKYMKVHFPNKEGVYPTA
jgi:chromatin remodeling complex protein RSC6